MKLKWISLFSLMAVLALLIPASLRADVHDNAQIFTQQAVDDADRDMQSMQDRYHKQLVVETFAAIPDDQKAAAAQDPATFFKNWMAARAKELKVNGVYVLICMDPRHLEVAAGKNTVARGEFTDADVIALRKQMQAALHDRDYDKALSGAVETVEHTFADNITTPARNNTSYSSSNYHPQYNAAPYTNSNTTDLSPGVGLTFGSLLCMVIGGIIIISLIRSVFRGGSGGSFGGGGYYPPGNQGFGGNYGGNYGGNWGGGGGYGYGGAGSGFGKGFLGGLLGGAIGGYAADRFDHRNDQSNTGFFGGGSQSDSSGGSFGGGSSGFDSGPSDAGQGFSDNSSGGDFGSSSGGDSGGGGGSSGGDF
jgi:uncharacterized membrane protein YgcG